MWSMRLPVPLVVVDEGDCVLEAAEYIILVVLVNSMYTKMLLMFESIVSGLLNCNICYKYGGTSREVG